MLMFFFVGAGLGLANVEMQSPPPDRVLGPIQELGAGITPAVATDARRGVHVVFMREGRILYLKSTGAGKLSDTAEEVPQPEGQGDYNSPHLVLDSQGVPHLVFQKDFSGKSKRAWYTNRSGNRWKPPVAVLSVSEGRVNCPRLALSGTNAWVGGFTPGSDSNGKLVRLAGLDSIPEIVATANSPLWVPTPLVGEGGRVCVIGRAGSRGHFLQWYDLELHRVGGARKASEGCTGKTGEATAGFMDRQGVVHLAGICSNRDSQGAWRDCLWYNNSARVESGLGLIAGTQFAARASEFVYPTLAEADGTGLWLAYRDVDSGEGKLVRVVGDGFSVPVVFAPSVTRRLRWNPVIASAPGAGVHAIWDDGGRIFFRSIRPPATTGRRP